MYNCYYRKLLLAMHMQGLCRLCSDGWEAVHISIQVQRQQCAPSCRPMQTITIEMIWVLGFLASPLHPSLLLK